MVIMGQLSHINRGLSGGRVVLKYYALLSNMRLGLYSLKDRPH